MISARSVCMNVSRASGAGLCGVGSITLSGEKRYYLIYLIFLKGGEIKYWFNSFIRFKKK